MRRQATHYDAAAMAYHLRCALSGRGLKQADLARQAGVNDASLHRILKGTGYPDVESFLRLCDWLGVSADTFSRKGRAARATASGANGTPS